MSFNFIDFFIIIFLAIGIFKGWRSGGISSAINLVGTFLIFVIAYYLKNPVSTFMYQHWPFFSFGGIFQGISVFNILFYEALAYVFCLIILSILLKILLKVTGLVDKLLGSTILIALPSKIVGSICSLLQYFIYVFLLLFLCAQIPITAKYYNESYLGDKIVSHTPILSNITNKLYSSIREVYEVSVKYEGEDDKTNANLLSLGILLKYNIITLDGVNLLVDNGKLKISGIDEFISEWEENGEYVIDEDVSKTIQNNVDKTLEGVNTIVGEN